MTLLRLFEDDDTPSVVNIRTECLDGNLSVRQRARLWETQSSTHVYIGRGSVWGNPFSHNPGNGDGCIIVATRDEAIERYREYLLQQQDLLARLHELKGKVLGCWCKPKACHGDVLQALCERLT